MFDNNCKTQVYNKGIFSDPIINITGGEIVTVKLLPIDNKHQVPVTGEHNKKEGLL